LDFFAFFFFGRLLGGRGVLAGVGGLRLLGGAGADATRQNAARAAAIVRII